MGDEILFDPSWGVYDMAIGSSIVSAYAGLADHNSYGLQFDPPKEKTHKIVYSLKELELHLMYGEIRQMRESAVLDIDRVEIIFQKLKSNHKKDWLLVLEIYELAKSTNNLLFIKEIKSYLDKLSKNKTIAHLINDGIQLIR